MLHLADFALKVRDQLVASVDFPDHFVDPRMSVGKLPLQFDEPVGVMSHVDLSHVNQRPTGFHGGRSPVNDRHSPGIWGV